MHRGYIKIWRRLKDSFFYEDSQAVHLFIHLILSANHKPTEFIFNGRKITLERGQMLTGRKVLSKETRIGQHKIYNLLEIFEQNAILVQQKTNKYTVITIQNYDMYQERDNTGTTQGQHRDTSKECRRMLKNTTTTMGKEIKQELARIKKWPTPDEIQQYADSIGYPLNAQYFFDYQEARGWRLGGGNPIKDWKAVIRTWRANEKKREEKTWTEKLHAEIEAKKKLVSENK